MTDHPEERVLEVLIGPATVRVDGSDLRLPIQLVQIPIDGWIHGFERAVVDEEGRELPDGLLHHVNRINPDRREPFYPIALRVVARKVESRLRRASPYLSR